MAVLDVMKRTSTACVAVPHEGHVVNYWPFYIRWHFPDATRDCSPKDVGCNLPLCRLRRLHPPELQTKSPIHEMVHPVVVQIFCGVSHHVRSSDQMKLAEAPSLGVGRAVMEMKHVVA